MPSSEHELAPPALFCFGGNRAPDSIVQGFRMFLSLPEHAGLGLWPLIESTLTEDDADPAKMSQFYGQQHNVESSRILHALHACDVLLRQAAALNLNADEFQKDLESLGPGSASPARLLMPHFREVKRWLRARILEDTLSDHGKVLTDVQWRVEDMRASNRGAALDTRILHLALRFRDGDQSDSLQLQLTPDSVRGLRQLLDQLGEESQRTAHEDELSDEPVKTR